MQEMNSIP